VTEQTIRNRNDAGKLPAYGSGDRRARISREDLDAFIRTAEKSLCKASRRTAHTLPHGAAGPNFRLPELSDRSLLATGACSLELEGGGIA
jgi:hypothetical protein